MQIPPTNKKKSDSLLKQDIYQGLSQPVTVSKTKVVMKMLRATNYKRNKKGNKKVRNSLVSGIKSMKRVVQHAKISTIYSLKIAKQMLLSLPTAISYLTSSSSKFLIVL